MTERELDVDRGMLICLVAALINQIGGKGVVTMREIENEIIAARLDIEFDSKTKAFILSCVGVS